MLPSLTLGLFQMTLIMRLVRAEMLEVLRTDYIKFARARGLPEATINYDHALRNTLIPVITVIGLQFGNIFAFSIVVETVFQWPGLGLLVIQSIQFADVPLLASYLVLIALGLRADQSCCRSPLRRNRSTRARRCDACADRVVSLQATTQRGAPRWWEGDLVHDFSALRSRSSPASPHC